MADRYAQPRELKGVPKEVILYQYEVCPFCCKVKAFLDFHKASRGALLRLSPARLCHAADGIYLQHLACMTCVQHVVPLRSTY